MTSARPAPPAAPHRPKPDEQGSISVAAAGIMVVALVLALVAVDLGRVLQAKARAQTAADSAALAAVQEMVRPRGSTPGELALEYARRNGATLVACQCDAGATEATVTVELEVSLIFLSSPRSLRSQARAVAGVGG
jgi:secretion/DNA translocation related TadE-like protein